MIARALLVFALLAAFVPGPRAFAMCAAKPAVACAGCCENADCCQMSKGANQFVPHTPDRAIQQADDLATTAIFSLVYSTLPAIRPHAHSIAADWKSAHLPPLLARTCIRLV